MYSVLPPTLHVAHMYSTKSTWHCRALLCSLKTESSCPCVSSFTFISSWSSSLWACLLSLFTSSSTSPNSFFNCLFSYRYMFTLWVVLLLIKHISHKPNAKRSQKEKHWSAEDYLLHNFHLYIFTSLILMCCLHTVCKHHKASLVNHLHTYICTVLDAYTVYLHIHVHCTCT